MKQGIQLELDNEFIRKYGCYYLCLLEWASRLREDEEGEPVDYQEDFIMDFAQMCQTSGWLDSDYYARDPAKIFNKLMGRKVFRDFQIIGKTASSLPPDVPAYLICNKLPGGTLTHFTLRWGGEDGFTWDPLPPDRPTAAQYRVHSYRVGVV